MFHLVSCELRLAFTKGPPMLLLLLGVLILVLAATGIVCDNLFVLIRVHNDNCSLFFFFMIPWYTYMYSTSRELVNSFLSSNPSVDHMCHLH